MTQHDHTGHDHASHSHAGHDHAGHGHSHAPKDFGFAFILGACLNVAFVLVEGTFGFIGNSTALLADAGHNLSDVLGLVVAWVAYGLSRRAPDARFTYGLRSSSILAALFNALILLLAVGAIMWEAAQRLFHPQPVASTTMIVVALVGILINGATAWLFASGRKGDINIRGAFMHMIADAVVSAGVVIAGIAIWLTGLVWIDALVSIAIAIVILWGTWGLLRDSVRLSLAGVPAHIDMEKLRTHIEHLPGVTGLHDLHVWPISTTETALTCHVLMVGGHPGDAFLMQTASALKRDFQIAHSTIQVETNPQTTCALAPAEVV